MGLREEAPPVSAEAVALYRELAELNRDAYLPDLAVSLRNHAVRLVETGRREEALLISAEAVKMYRELAVLNRDAYLPALAMSLNNHAVLLAEVGRREEALPVSKEAVKMYRELAVLNRDAYLPALAAALGQPRRTAGRDRAAGGDGAGQRRSRHPAPGTGRTQPGCLPVSIWPTR
ncbi:tetratricopeptide repeat protein [Nonomuraea dietziae]|uniref:tetratricopeptide repeat protein n=1 Tax=Nonomuraea dietziae TaxID=65515 RepID=UPI0031DEE737